MGSLSNTVVQIVNTVGENTEWSDFKKREEAIRQIKAVLANQGKTFKDSTLSLALEIAVKVWKGGAL